MDSLAMRTLVKGNTMWFYYGILVDERMLNALTAQNGYGAGVVADTRKQFNVSAIRLKMYE